MTDEGRDWKWRPPPRGFTADDYAPCDSWENGNNCQYGAQCVEAHGPEELAEWKERFEYRKMKMQRACEKELYGKSYIERLLEKWSQATSPEKIMRERVDDVEDSCSAELTTTVSSKVSKQDWIFTLKTKRNLEAVALLQDAHRNHFSIKQICPGEPKGQKSTQIDLSSDQEWMSVNGETGADEEREHRVKISFCTDIYGTFRQSVVFDLGFEPVLVKHLCVDVVPVTDADKIKELRKEMILSSTKRWDGENSDVVPFNSPVYPGLATPYGKEASDRDRELLNAYPAPRANTLCLTQATVTERNLTKNNYRARMHELLCVEELARCEQVARYNLTCRLRVAPSYLLAPSGIATNTAKYAHAGELFALLTLGKDVSEDTSAGRLILNNCTTVLLASSTSPSNARRRVYECLIEDKGKNMIYLRMSAITVRELGMRPDSDFSADIQFQLNRLTYCEWHYAIDRITDYRLIFPDTTTEPNIPWSPNRQWDDTLDFRLNVKQKEAVLAITTPIGIPIPPILIIGPFGTGKTYTLAQAIKKLLLQPESKILICTHSNSAADLYIKDYIHPWLEDGITDAKPLRIYYHKRWVSTVDEIVQQYCLIEMGSGVRHFQLPTLENVLKHRIVVVTLSISMCLSTLGLPKGYFTHILLDEAAQAMESEALMPLAMATPVTRIVLAGDHMQLSPELFSQFAKERNLHVSLLERLYEHYPATFPCKILLCENYRAHDAIIRFTSELFYEQMLIASGKQPRHNKFYPLTFFTARGEDVQDQNSTAFYNNSEVYEVVERVHELRTHWPAAWGKYDEHSIGIMTPYADQVFRIRSELRKRRMGGISVERVLNVQGKQFRAVFLSTVRTRRTCQAAAELDYGFLSNRKLLNTAITRAQSLVAVVGDPVALCSIGRCRKVWERFLTTCNENNSFFGISWSLLRSQLDGVELKKTYTLNPLAPEFVPRAMQPEAYIKYQVSDVTGPPLVQGATTMNIPMPPVNTLRQPTATQIQPLMNSGNTPIIQYPMYYYPSGTNQPANVNTNVMPIVRAPLPQQPVSLSNIPPYLAAVSPWTQNSFPLSSPNDLNTPTWAKHSLKKPLEANTGVAPPLRNPRLVVPSRFPEQYSQILTPQMISNKNPHFIPMPPGQQRLSPENMSNTSTVLTENFAAANDLNSSSYVRNNSVPNMLPEHMPFPNKAPETTALITTPKEKEQIQFLQNVHFPERASLIRDLQSNMSSGLPFQDLPAESQEAHIRWYRHLFDTQGAESAAKFMDVISQKRIMPPQTIKTPNVEVFPHGNEFARNVEDVYVEKVLHNNQNFVNFNIPNGHGLLTTNMSELNRPWSVPEQQKYPNSSVGQFVNSKNFLRELDSSTMINNSTYNQNTQREEKILNQRTYNPSETVEVPWEIFNPSQSVPLYRRQATNQSNNMANQNDTQMSQVFLDTHLDKQNSTTGAFAGYAKALSLQQAEPMLMNQHNPLLVSDRLINGEMASNYRYLGHNNIVPQRLQQQPNIDYSRPLNGSIDNAESGDNTTYASVLRQSTPKLDEEKSDPMTVLRDFGHKHQAHGLYHYFN